MIYTALACRARQPLMLQLLQKGPQSVVEESQGYAARRKSLFFNLSTVANPRISTVSALLLEFKRDNGKALNTTSEIQRHGQLHNVQHADRAIVRDSATTLHDEIGPAARMHSRG